VVLLSLLPPCVADADIIHVYLPCGFCHLNLFMAVGRPMGRPLYFCPVVSFFYLLLSFFFSSPNLCRCIGYLPYFYTWCGPSANLECTSEMCCTHLLEMHDPKKSPKICNLGTIAQLCRAVSSQQRHVSTIGKKLVKQQYLPHMSL